MSLKLRLDAYRKQIDLYLEKLLPLEKEEPLQLHAAMRYSCLAPGKRLRPLLCLATAEALGENPEKRVDVACAIEMVHCFSLIHDDLPAIDNDDLRRGRATCHKVFGEAMALLAGDGLFALAFQVLSNAPYPPEKLVCAMQILTLATGSRGLVGGEVLDILSEGQTPSLELLESIHHRKTGVLIAASCMIGGLLCGASEQQIKQLEGFGSSIGLAFQIADDVLNEVSTPEELGKAVGSDRAKFKMTYPALMGIETAKKTAKELKMNAEKFLEGMPGDCSLLLHLAQYSVERAS